jgi:hypothetical protein
LALAEIAYIAGRDELVPALRAVLVVVAASQLVLAWGLLKRSSGAVLGVYLFEATAFVAAIAGGDGAGRLVLAVGAAAVVVLLSMSLRAFPAPQLPAPTSRPVQR